MSLRVDDQGRRVQQAEQVLIGDNERYRAVCTSCFYSEGDDPGRAPRPFGWRRGQRRVGVRITLRAAGPVPGVDLKTVTPVGRARPGM